MGETSDPRSRSITWPGHERYRAIFQSPVGAVKHICKYMCNEYRLTLRLATLPAPEMLAPGLLVGTASPSSSCKTLALQGGGCCSRAAAQLNAEDATGFLFVLHRQSILTASKTLCMSYYFQIVSRLILQLKIGQLFNCSRIPIDCQYCFAELRISVYSLPQRRVGSVGSVAFI